jgi:hypothetical protein
MPLIAWPVLWILAMLTMIVAVAVAGMREKKSRAKSVSQSMQPMQVGADATAPVDGGDGFGDSFGATDGFGDDPFK